MQRKLITLALPFLVLCAAAPARAGSVCCKPKIAAALGLRYDKPVEGLQAGQKAPATIMNASKLSPHGLTCRNDEKVILTSTGKNTFSLRHEGSGKTLNFKVDAQGNVTPGH